ncbi:hypothetical protein T484DRAFT_2526754 [Baffinella frigidus]|nr:hypothetical protein T484DRAFT_2526754 [Cryptophyta sp. CCMP2293]
MLSYWLLISFAYMINGLAKVLGTLRIVEEHVVLRTLKLNVFTVTMLTIHRYFDISKAKKDLGYVPLKTFETGMAEVRSLIPKVNNPESKPFRK